MKDIKVTLQATRGLDKELRVCDIIEAPDHRKVIGRRGKVLLTGLYAFRSCTVDEFARILTRLKQERVCLCPCVKAGARKVENGTPRLKRCSRLPRKLNIPVTGGAVFEVSFRDVMSSDHGKRFFNVEVTRP